MELGVDGKIKYILSGTGYEGVDWIHPVQCRGQWRVLVKGNEKTGEFLDQLRDYQLLTKDSAQ